MHNKVKIFYSYSHADEKYRETLVKHLAILREEQLIEEWHDRKMDGGDTISKEIDKNMEDADIILLLISPDFIASKACQEEINKAFQVQKKSNAAIIPIILRSCSWQDDKRFKDILALPKDGKEISMWGSKDYAWKNVYEGIRNKVNGIITQKKPTLKEGFRSNLLKNPIIEHPLDKVFVFPDMEGFYDDEGTPEDKRVSSEKLKDIVNFRSPRVVIEGEDQSGKSSLCRILFLNYYEIGYFPILLNGADLRDGVNLDKAVNKEYKNQYNQNNSYFDIDIKNRVFLIDDIDENGFKEGKLKDFIEEIKSKFSYALIFIDDLDQFTNEVREDDSGLSGFEFFSIKQFGHERRCQLLKKCISLKEGREFDYDNESMVQQLDKDEEHVRVIIGSNIVPSYPVFILAIFQSIEIFKHRDYRLTSYGHCYHSMITISLTRANVPADEIDLYFNFLTHLAYFIFSKHDGSVLSSEDMDSFINEYKIRYSVGSRKGNILNPLIAAKLIDKGQYSFSYKYIYYYFVAKYITENLDKKETRDKIATLSSRLYKSDYANIIIFIAHHTRDKGVLDDILTNAICLFDRHSEAKLDKEEVEPVARLLRELPKQILENRDHKKERERKLQERDKKIQQEETHDEHDHAFIEIKNSVRTIEIIGQILKNRYGSLERGELQNLFSQAQNLGLRLLKCFLIDMFEDERSAIEFFQSRYEEKFRSDGGEMSQKELNKMAKKFFGFFSYNFMFGMIHKIARSIGYDKLIETADSVNSVTNTEASELINISIHTWYKKELDADKIRNLYHKFNGNIFAQRVLRDIVIHHLYMHKVDYKDKQKLSGVLNLSIEGQLTAQRKIEKSHEKRNH